MKRFYAGGARRDRGAERTNSGCSGGEALTFGRKTNPIKRIRFRGTEMHCAGRSRGRTLVKIKKRTPCAHMPSPDEREGEGSTGPEGCTQRGRRRPSGEGVGAIALRVQQGIAPGLTIIKSITALKFKILNSNSSTLEYFPVELCVSACV